jgi:NAD(P)-dependent dehydrogenase (short-subunit alcohol dehydrogenase family)
MSILSGKTALVTGAAGGIGSETVRAMCEAGARVVMTDIRQEPLDEVSRQLRGEGHDVAAKVADITEEASVIELLAFTNDTYGGLDILDNNAGATGYSTIDQDVADMTVDLWDTMLSINARGPMLLCKHALPVMVSRGGGSVINISSGQSLSGDLTNIAYAAGKAALNSMTRHIATAYGPRGIRCNAIAPGLIVPPGSEGRLPQAMHDIFVANCLVPRLGVPRDIANMAVFLASDLASYITGQVISVDGGILIHLPTTVPMQALRAQMAKG